jgi:erythronate-4-phosphate dehydrogenase
MVALLLEHARRHGRNLAETTIGIVGVGNVGSRVARNARALGMHVLLNDPPLARATGAPEYLPLEALMEADVITLHVPLTAEGPDPTYHLFDARRLGRMKQGSVLVNTSRGGVVDTGSLLAALQSGSCSAALLDVWEGEPAINAELLSKSESGTAHIAGFSFDGKINAARMLFTALSAWTRCGEEWTEPPGIPPPREERIEVATEGIADQELLRSVVARAYSITEDDALLRSILSLPEGERAARFRLLRAQYRTRREFRAHTVVLTPKRQSAGAVLASLGFQVA